MKRILSVLAILISAFTLHAQKSKNKAQGEPCRLIYHPVISDAAELLKDQPLWSKGMKKKKVKHVLAAGVQTAWPKGLSNPDERLANQFNLKKMICYQVAEYIREDGAKMRLLQIPADSNQHLPAELRPAKDIYMLVKSWCVLTGRIYDQKTDGAPLRYYRPDEFYPGIFGHCRITDRGEMFSSVDLNDQSGWQEFFAPGMAEIVAEYANQKNWPDKISTLEGRQENEKYFKYYNAYAVARFKMGSTTAYIVQIAAYENEHMPEGMAPVDDDIYFVIGEAGLDLSRGWDEYIDGYPDAEDEATTEDEPAPAPAPTPAPAPVEEPGGMDVEITPGNPVDCYIIDRGSLYSTLSLETYRDEVEPYVSDFAYVAENANEDAWPEGIKTLDGREARNELFRQYKVKAVARFGESFYLLEVKPEDNEHMQADMRPARTIYFIMGAPGLSAEPAAK